MISSKRIVGLEVLRAIAFIGVYLSHTRIEAFSEVGKFSVSIFLILSGFVTNLDLTNKEINILTIKDCFHYLKNRIKRLYPLHIITTLFMFPFVASTNNIDDTIKSLVLLILNVLLIVEWFPLGIRSINGPSWFLNTIVIAYIASPWLIKKIKSFNNRIIIISILILVIIEPLSSYYGYLYLDHNLFEWLVFSFPLIRLIEFVVGCFLGELFIRKIYNIKYSNLVETLIVIVSLICIVVAQQYKNEWWTYSLLYLLPSCFLIIVFSSSSGVILKILSNKTLLFIASISSYAYLIHNVVFRYSVFLLYHIPIIGGHELYNKYNTYFRLFFGIPFTIMFSVIYKKLLKITKNCFVE